MNTMETRAQKVAQFFNQLNAHERIDVAYHIDCESVECYDDVYQQLDDAGAFDIEIIYYSEAIKYLQEEDPSLCDSLEIAQDLGYSLDQLSSETLAMLHASHYSREKFAEYEDEITEFFETLNEEMPCD